MAHPEIDSTQGAALTKAAFDKLPYVGDLILSVGIVTFAFSTILGWSYYGERSLEYLAGRNKKAGKIVIAVYRTIWIVAVFVGSVMSLSVVWNLADIANAFMAIPNLVSILLLSGVIVKETRKYLWEKRLEEDSEEEIPTL